MVYESQPGTVRIERTPNGATIALPRMWYVFVFGCLVFSAFVAARLVLEFPGFPLFLTGLAKIVGLIGLFLWVTLRDSLSPEDISPSGPGWLPLRRRLLLLCGMLLITTALIPLLPELELWWLLAYTMVAAGLALPLVPATLVTGGLTILSLACAWFFNDTFQPILLSQAVLALGAVIIRMMTVTNIELTFTRDDVARLAVTEERLRFARDLHDSLGHTLSVIVLKSELGGRLVRENPERASEEIGDVERVARHALQEVRSVVTGYRQPTLKLELASAREILDAANISAIVEGSPDLLPPEIDSLLAWGIREGVTNVIRHSGASACTIRIDEGDGSVRLVLIDDGNGTPEATESHDGGSGLAGLAERVALAGGKMTAGSLPTGGFQLVLETPIQQKSGVMA